MVMTILCLKKKRKKKDSDQSITKVSPKIHHTDKHICKCIILTRNNVKTGKHNILQHKSTVILLYIACTIILKMHVKRLFIRGTSISKWQPARVSFHTLIFEVKNWSLRYYIRKWTLSPQHITGEKSTWSDWGIISHTIATLVISPLDQTRVSLTFDFNTGDKFTWSDWGVTDLWLQHWW